MLKFNEIDKDTLEQLVPRLAKMVHEIESGQFPAGNCMKHPVHYPDCYACALTTMNSYFMNRVCYLELLIERLEKKVFPHKHMGKKK